VEGFSAMKNTWTTSELTADGSRRDSLTRRVTDGELVRLRRGAYGLATPLSERAAHLRLLTAHVATIASDAVASHASAALLHGLPVERRLLERAWVTRSSPLHGRTTSTLHQFRGPLDPAIITLVDGIACTSAARAAAEVASITSFPWAVAAWDALLHLGLATPFEIEDALASLGRRPGSAQARASARIADGRAESALESISRWQIARLGLPTPELQYTVRSGGRLLGRGDFAWPDYRLIGEADGASKYRDQAFDDRTATQVILDEKRREELFREEGWWLCRWDWATAHDPAALDRRIRSGLRHGAHLRPSSARPDVSNADEPRPHAS